MVLAQAAWAAQFLGVIDSTLTFSTASPNISFASIAPAATTLLNFGTTTGPSVAFNIYSATGTNFMTSIQARAQMDVQVGAGSSAINLNAEAISGTVRITNSGASATKFTISESLLYSLQTIGPGTELAGLFSYFERFDTTTSAWVPLGAFSFGIENDELKNFCSAACVATSAYSVAAQSFVDVRERAGLGAELSQPAGVASNVVPEPTSVVLLGTGFGLAWWLRRRRSDRC